MMAAGNPNWWSMQHTNNPLHPTSSSDVQSHPFIHLLNNQFNLHGGPSSSSSSSSSSSASSASSSLPFSPLIADQSIPQDLPQRWSQLLLNGMANTNEEERLGASSHFQFNHVINPSSSPPLSSNHLKLASNEANFGISHHHHHHHHQQQQQQQQQQQNMVKQEVAVDPRNTLYSHGHSIYNQPRPSTNWSQISPKCSVTTLSNNKDNNNNFMDFSTNCFKGREKNQLVEHLSEQCNSPSNTTSVAKKPKVQVSSTPPLKVRKEKLGDRITALHQLVSPFGKTDTASVLLEAIGYIRFLQGQVEALCSPYMGSVSAMNQQIAHGERNGLFPDHPGQLLNDSCMKRRGAANQKDGSLEDLRSRGLCLVPISCTQLVASDNTADFWAPSLGPPGF